MRLKLLFILTLLATLAPACRAESGTTIPFQFSRNLIWVKVQAPGRQEPLTFLFDTGAGMTVMNLQTARELGLKFGAPTTVQGVNSRSMARWVEGFDATVAGVPVRSRLLAIDLSAASKVCKQRIDGLIGADFLQNRVVRIDYTTGGVTILDRSQRSEVRGEALPLRKQNDGFCVPLCVAGKKAQWMRLDTGCDEALHWVMNKPDSLKNLHMVSIGLSGSALQYATTEVQLGAACFADVKTGIQQRQIFSGEDGLLGNGLLSRFVVTIDMPHKTAFFDRKKP